MIFNAKEVSMKSPPQTGDQVHLKGILFDVAECGLGWYLSKDNQRVPEIGIHPSQQQFVKAIQEESIRR